MPIQSHFTFADDYIAHTNSIVTSISDPFIKQRYIGFVTISAVTAYELAIKDIFINFARQKNKTFGTVVEKIYEKINGRISIRDLKEEHIKRFGDKYLNKFNKNLETRERSILRSSSRSIKSSYGNIVTWRHVFVHQGQIASNASYTEAVNSYEAGKEIIFVLYKSMRR